MPSFKKSLTTAAAIGLLVAAGAAEAQTSVFVVDTATWNAGTFGAGLDAHKFAFLRTIAELAAADAGGYTFIQNAAGMGEVNFEVAETYTQASDIAAIKAWLAAQPDQNATGLTLTTSVPASLDAGSVSTVSWTNTGMNLQPFSVTSACNTTAVDEAFAAFNAIPAGGPAPCVTDVVDAMKRIYAAPAGTNCLGHVAFAMTPFATYCADPSFVNNLETAICTDGATGAAAFCDYVTSMMASGQLGYGPVYSANTDGVGVTYATPEPATTPAPLGATNAPGGAAGGIAPPALSVVAAVAVALASAMLAA